MNNRSVYFLLAISVVFVSCKEVTVVVDRAIDDSLNGPIHIVIDEKYEYKNITDTSFALELKPGTHNIKINNGKEQEFEVGDEGGILNISNQEYVAFEILYKSTNPPKDAFDMEEISVKFPAIVDSYFVSIKNKPDEVIPDTSILGLLPYLNGEKKSIITEEENVSGLRTVGKNKLFIDKFWEYNITDTIPRKLSEMNQNKSITRTTIQRANRFLLMAMLDTEQYFVRSIPEIHRKISGKK